MCRSAWSSRLSNELPFGPGKKWLDNKGAVGQIAGGWRVSGIYTASSGEPTGVNDVGYNYCNAARMITVRPNVDRLSASLRISTDHHSMVQYPGVRLVRHLHLQQQSCGVGRAGSSVLGIWNHPALPLDCQGSRVNNLDLSVQKEFRLPLGEQGRLRFRADFFNTFNHTQFNAPDPTSSANFARISLLRGYRLASYN